MKQHIMSWIKNLIHESFPNLFSATSSYLESFRAVFDAEALCWLSAEGYMLLFACLMAVTIGLVKTTNARGVDIVYLNNTAKYFVLMVLFGTGVLVCYRSAVIGDTVYLLNDMVILDNWVNWSQLGVLILSFIFVSLSSPHSYTRNSYYYETMLWTLIVTMLMTWLVMSWNFIVFYLVLEGISLIFYTIATRTFTYGGVESGLKYYSLGAIASVLLLVGILCVFSATGSTDFLVASLWLKWQTLASPRAVLLAVGLTLILMAFLFKLSAFPGHVWTPDVYEGTSLETLWIFAVLSKYLFVVVFLRFFILFYFTPNMLSVTSFWISTACLGSLIIGAIGAFSATSIKRFIAYTAINQMGFLFMGLSVLTVDGLKSTIAYLYIYMLANVLFFAVVTSLQSKKLLAGDSSVRSLKDFALMKKDPISVGLMAVALLSLGGLPPLAGFFGKYALWSTVISHYLETPETGAAENLLYILITSVVVSLLSTFYYLRLIKMALFDSFSNVDVKTPGVTTGNLVDVSLSSFFVVLLGVVTIGWAFMLTDLDMVWSRFVVALVSPFTSYTNPFDWS